MAHFAKVINGTVEQVIVADQEFIDALEDSDLWIQTSYNTRGGVHLEGGIPLRKNYAGIGYSYDAVRDAFIPPKPFDSWVLDDETCLWAAPVPVPQDGKEYAWNEANKAWDVFVPPVPEVVTMRQARLALMQAGLLAQVNTAITNMPGEIGDAARIEWEFSSTVERNRPLVLSLIGALGFTESQLDDLFRQAAAL